MKIFVAVVIMFVSIVVCRPAAATTINYELTALGSDSFEYVYTVQNDTLQIPIEEFTIWFDQQLYGNLQIMTQAPLSSKWDEIILTSTGFGVPLGYDALNTNGIAPAQSLGGFTVRFDWLGTGIPGRQSFEIINPLNSQLIESGVTIPEPLTISLFCIGMLMLKRQR